MLSLGFGFHDNQEYKQKGFRMKINTYLKWFLWFRMLMFMLFFTFNSFLRPLYGLNSLWNFFLFLKSSKFQFSKVGSVCPIKNVYAFLRPCWNQIFPFIHEHCPYHISRHILWTLSATSLKTLTIHWGVVVSIGLVSWLKIVQKQQY